MDCGQSFGVSGGDATVVMKEWNIYVVGGRGISGGASLSRLRVE